MVPTVPMTAMRPVTVARRAARRPGSMTLTTGTSIEARSPSRPAAAAVLHATTISLASVFADQLGGDLPGEGPHLVQRPRAVGIAAGVADVDEVLLREQVDDSPGYRQTAESAVKHADRTDVHGERSLAMPSPASEHSQALRVGCKQAPTCRRGAREGSGPVEVNRLRPRPATGARSK